MTVLLRAGAIALALGCTQGLEPGELGPVRYFAEVRGEAPMRLIPPLTDRDGNIYVVYGAPNRTDTQVFVGHRPGGWSGGCAAHRGLYGLHGFVGRSTDRVWIWSGTALIEVDGATGACRQVLQNDPVSGTELQFLGVAPYVDETPSRRFAYALVQGATGSAQFVMIDLDRGLPFNPTPVPGNDGEEITVIATGAWDAIRTTVFVTRSGEQVTATFLDRLGAIVREVPIDLPRNVGAYEVPGFLEFSDDGIGVGLTVRGRALVVTRDSGGYADEPFATEGVLRWGGAVYLTTRDGGAPLIARLSGEGTVGPVASFDAAATAAQALRGEVVVNDERSPPARTRRWDSPVSAIGGAPLVSPWSIDPYTLDSAGWLLAGPSFDSGVEPVTATAFAPIGVMVP